MKSVKIRAERSAREMGRYHPGARLSGYYHETKSVKRVTIPMMLPICAVMISLAVPLCHSAFADGLHISNGISKVSEPYQKAVIHWDGRTETMILSSGVMSQDIANFAWIVPLQSQVKPEVTAGDMSLFEYLSELFWYPYPTHLPASSKGYGNGRGGVQVVETKEIDFYDITILKASDPIELMEWLDENGYIVPQQARHLLEAYTEYREYYFIVNKIDLENRFENEIRVQERIDSGEHLAFADIRGVHALTALDAALLSEGSSLESYNRFKESTMQLRRGLGTPLKIVFRPDKPYYPLEISGVNNGDTRIVVYVISERRVFDSSGIMKDDTPVRITRSIREELAEHGLERNAKYLTRLQYRGKSSGLKYNAALKSY
jgi:hypothetical protein